MIFMILPCSISTGWGVCSTNLVKQISQKTKVKYVSSEIDNPTIVKSPIEHEYFKSLQFSNLAYLREQKKYPIIQALEHDLSCYLGEFEGSFKVGICFSDRRIPQKYTEKSKKFDAIISGSEWSKKLLESYNVKSQVILQGVDPLLFNINRSKKEMFQDDFVVFSGGVFHERKGQDVTIKAFKVLQDRHPDVKLVTCWHNLHLQNNGIKALIDSKINLNKVIHFPENIPNFFMPQIYQNTDVGMFPSRCEAGTNLVMMEYMACGKPPIATVGTGQADIINIQTGLTIDSVGICDLIDSETAEIISQWEQPNVDSAIEQLEYAYSHQREIKTIGNQAAKLMKKYTWKFMAESILKLIPCY